MIDQIVIIHPRLFALALVLGGIALGLGFSAIIDRGGGGDDGGDG